MNPDFFTRKKQNRKSGGTDAILSKLFTNIGEDVKMTVLWYDLMAKYLKKADVRWKTSKGCIASTRENLKTSLLADKMTWETFNKAMVFIEATKFDFGCGIDKGNGVKLHCSVNVDPNSTDARGALSMLFRQIVTDLQIGRNCWSNLLDSYVGDTRRGLVKRRDEQSSKKGTLNRELHSMEMSWKTFCKGLGVLRVGAVTFECAIHYAKQPTTTHSISVQFGGVVDIDEFAKDDRLVFIDKKEKDADNE